MSDPTRSCIESPPCPPILDDHAPTPTLDRPPGAADVATAAAGAQATVDAADAFVSLDVLEESARMLQGMERVARFGQHLFGEPQYTEAPTGRVVAAAVETAAGAAADTVLGDATAVALGRVPAAAGGLITAADAALDTDDAPKIFSSFLAEVQPATVGADATSLLVDVGTIAFADHDAALERLETVEDGLYGGDYGAVLQGAALVGSVTVAPEETSARVTSPSSSQGDDGVFVAWGNAVGDLWADVVHGETGEPRTVPLDDVEGRKRLLGF